MPNNENLLPEKCISPSGNILNLVQTIERFLAQVRGLKTGLWLGIGRFPFLDVRLKTTVDDKPKRENKSWRITQSGPSLKCAITVRWCVWAWRLFYLFWLIINVVTNVSQPAQWLYDNTTVAKARNPSQLLCDSQSIADNSSGYRNNPFIHLVLKIFYSFPTLLYVN